MIGTVMINATIGAGIACVAFLIGMLVQQRLVCQHRLDDGTDRYEIVPYRRDSDKLRVNRKTVYRCTQGGCPTEKTVLSSVNVVHRDTFETALDDISAFDARD